MFGGLGFRFLEDIPLNPPRPKSFFQFVTTLLRVRRRASMESGVQDDRSIGQEVMSSQVRDAAPQEPRRLEGETHGPNYDGGPRALQQLPNGVPHREAGSSPVDSVGLESVAYSPTAVRAEAAGLREAGEQRAQGSPQAFSQVVWPTQPEHGPGEPS